MMSVRVIVQRPGHPELRKEFSTSPVRVGRNPMNDLPLAETYVSEWHAAIRFDGYTVEFTDLGSTNGTVLDGQKLTAGTPAAVSGPTVFQIGPLSMMIEPAFEGASAEEDVGVARTMMPGTPAPVVSPSRPASPADQPQAASGGGFNPPTLFGDKAFPVGPAAGPPPHGGAWQSPHAPSAGAWKPQDSPPQGSPQATGDSAKAAGSLSPPTLFGMPRETATRARVATEPAMAPVAAAPAAPSGAPGGAPFNPPTLFGVSAGILRPPASGGAAAPAAPASPAAQPSPSLGADKNANPPSLFGFSPQQIIAAGSVAPVPAPTPPVPRAPAPQTDPAAPFPSFNPPTLFGDRAALMPPAEPPAAAPGTGFRATGGVKAGAPPTLFGVASGAIAKPALPGMAAPRSSSPVPPEPANASAAGPAWAPAVAPSAPGGAWGTPAAEPPSQATPPRTGGSWSERAPEPAAQAPVAGAWSTPSSDRPTQSPPEASPQARPAWGASPDAQPQAHPASPMPKAPPSAASADLMDSAVGMTRAMAGGDRPELKMQAVLRAFCDAFVDLRRGFEETGAELGVRTVSGSTPLYSARDGGELMKYMTEPKADPIARGQELRAFMADFAAHQVAMMEGVNRGVRAVLTSLDPQGYDIEKGPRFMPILDRERWRQYTDRFGALLESDHELNAMVFGAEFAEGYAEVIYGAKNRKGGR